MAKNTIRTYSTTAASNTDVGGVDIQGTAPASNMDDSVRELMSHLAETNAGTAPVDDTWSFCDPADATKKVRFDAGNVTAGQTRVLAVPNFDGTIATLAGTETLTNKTLSDSTTTVIDNSDPTKIGAFQLSGVTAGNTRTVTWPDASGTMALTTDIALTPVGAVAFYGGTAAPTGWLLCYGQNVSRTTYSALFTAISTTYGVGDGITTFTLPDIRGRVIAGQDDMGGSSADRLTNPGTTTGGIDGDVLGGTGGAETHVLTAAQVPANDPVARGQYSGGSTNDDTVEDAHTGTGTAHNNVQPTIILNAIIFAGVRP